MIRKEGRGAAYEAPAMNVIELAAADVVVTSPQDTVTQLICGVDVNGNGVLDINELNS